MLEAVSKRVSSSENPVTELEDELENSKENKEMEIMSENAMRLEGWLQGQMDRWMDGWMADGQMNDGWTAGCLDGQCYREGREVQKNHEWKGEKQ